MIQTENDYFETAQNGTNTRKDFHALIPRYLSHQIRYDTPEFHSTSYSPPSFIVDWQLREDTYNAEQLWF
ncbi:MAG TPA: hypothetical protein DCL77_00950 [Prolixibacteraceae bacterium]|jgi:hypothetical protein|nr:hypothetical protein [Prolixibacteraceae bacterium]